MQKALAAVVAVLMLAVAAFSQEWPDLSRPAASIGGGDRDAAVLVGIEGYAFVPPVVGAESNAKYWYDYLTKTRGVAPQNVRLLTGVDATSDEILDAVQKAAAQAGPEGSLWFVFIGHGAPSFDGKDGLLVGVDAQQKAKSLEQRSLRRGELLKALSASRAGAIQVVLDACFSGRQEDGSPLAPGLQPLATVSLAGPVDPRLVVLTAAKGNQYAGALPGAQRPAFSYLVLGGLRGWAGKAKVTAGDLLRYASDTLEATLRGRNQTPELMGRDDAVVAVSAGEQGPDLAALAKATAGGSAREEMFKFANLPAVPKVEAPKALDISKAGRPDFGTVDMEALAQYNKTVNFDKVSGSAEEKAQKWRDLAQAEPKFADMAGKRAEEWESYALKKKEVAELEKKKRAMRDTSWDQLSPILALGVITDDEKRLRVSQYLEAFLESPGIEPWMAKRILPFVPEGTMRASVEKISLMPIKESDLKLIMNEESGRWGYKNSLNKMVIEPRFLSFNNFSEGLAAVEVQLSCNNEPPPFRGCDNEWGYIDEAGDEKIAPKFAYAYDFQSGFAGVCTSNGEWGFIDRTGKLVIEPQFDDVGPFSDGYAAVQMYVDVNRPGKYIAATCCRHGGCEGNGTYGHIGRGGKWGYINEGGQMMIEPQFLEAESFESGIARVKRTKESGYLLINKQGQVTVPNRRAKPSTQRHASVKPHVAPTVGDAVDAVMGPPPATK